MTTYCSNCSEEVAQDKAGNCPNCGGYLKSQKETMNTSSQKEIEILSKYEEEMLDLIHGVEELPPEELANCIGSILLNVYRLNTQKRKYDSKYKT